MSAFALTTVTLRKAGWTRRSPSFPPAAGVGQILADGERNLVIGRPSNLRRWAAGHLGPRAAAEGGAGQAAAAAADRPHADRRRHRLR